MTLAPYVISASWDARPETPEDLAARLLRLLGRLDGLHSAFADWIWCGEQPIPFEDVRDRLAHAIRERVTRDDYGDPDPSDGYWAALINELRFTPQSVGLLARGGSVSMDPGCNHASIDTAWRLEPNPTLVTFDVFRPAVLALAESYDVKWCAAYPKDLVPLWPENQRFSAAWMSYIKPDWAPLISPPSNAIVEHRPNGGLFMAATADTFRIQNPDHLAVANEIVASLAPLRAMSDGWERVRAQGRGTA